MGKLWPKLEIDAMSQPRWPYCQQTTTTMSYTTQQPSPHFQHVQNCFIFFIFCSFQAHNFDLHAWVTNANLHPMPRSVEYPSQVPNVFHFFWLDVCCYIHLSNRGKKITRVNKSVGFRANMIIPCDAFFIPDNGQLRYGPLEFFIVMFHMIKVAEISSARWIPSSNDNLLWPQKINK